LSVSSVPPYMPACSATLVTRHVGHLYLAHRHLSKASISGESFLSCRTARLLDSSRRIGTDRSTYLFRPLPTMVTLGAQAENCFNYQPMVARGPAPQSRCSTEKGRFIFFS